MGWALPSRGLRRGRGSSKPQPWLNWTALTLRRKKVCTSQPAAAVRLPPSMRIQYWRPCAPGRSLQNSCPSHQHPSQREGSHRRGATPLRRKHLRTWGSFCHHPGRAHGLLRNSATQWSASLSLWRKWCTSVRSWWKQSWKSTNSIRMSTLPWKKESSASVAEPGGFPSSPGLTPVSSVRGPCAHSVAKRCGCLPSHTLLYLSSLWDLLPCKGGKAVRGQKNPPLVTIGLFEVLPGSPQNPGLWTSPMRSSSFPKSSWRTGARWRCVWTAKSSSPRSSAQAGAAWCWLTKEPGWKGRHSLSTCPRRAPRSTALQNGLSTRSEPCAFPLFCVQSGQCNSAAGLFPGVSFTGSVCSRSGLGCTWDTDSRLCSYQPMVGRRQVSHLVICTQKA